MTSSMLRRELSDAVQPLGWRYIHRMFRTSVATDSLTQATMYAAAAVQACGGDESHLRADLRPDRLELYLHDPDAVRVGAREIALVQAITDALHAIGATPTPGPLSRPVQQIELAIDALDIASVRPFWQAILGYVGDFDDGPTGALVDPAGQGPSIWFQQMDEPRTQRNRIHFDIDVPHDQAEARLTAALAAGGELVTAEYAPAFWVLADPEGNEICICTWMERDERGW